MIIVENISDEGSHVRHQLCVALDMLGHVPCTLGRPLFGDWHVPYDQAEGFQSLDIDLSNYADLEVEGLKLWDICGEGIGVAPGEMGFLAELRRQYASAKSFILFVKDAIGRHQPSAALVWGNQSVESRILCGMFRQNGLPCFRVMPTGLPAQILLESGLPDDAPVRIDISGSVDQTASAIGKVFAFLSEAGISLPDFASDPHALRIVIVHPSPARKGSGFYLQDLAVELVALGHQVIVLSEGRCVPWDDGVHWRRLAFDGQFLSPAIRDLMDGFRPDVVLQVGVRTAPIRAALEIALVHRPLVVVQGEDDDLQPFGKYYPTPRPALLDGLDKGFVTEADLAAFLQELNYANLAATLADPEKYRWVEPLLRSAMFHVADRFCGIWHPMCDRLSGRYGKPCDVLPPVVRPELFDTSTIGAGERARLLGGLDLPKDTLVYFINGAVYPYSDEFRIFLDAFALLQERSPVPVALLICGNPKLEETAKDRITHFRALGQLANDDYETLIRLSDVICAPGVPDSFNRYRLSSRLVKAFVHGKPVFTFRTGFGESLLADRDGFFTDSADSGEWAEILCRTLDPRARQEVGTRGRALIAQHFDAARVAADLVANWRAALQNRRPGAATGLVSQTSVVLLFNRLYQRHVPFSLREDMGPHPFSGRNVPVIRKDGCLVMPVNPGRWRERGGIPLRHGCIGLSVSPHRRTPSVSLVLAGPATIRDPLVFDASGPVATEVVPEDGRLVVSFTSHQSDFLVFIPEIDPGYSLKEVRTDRLELDDHVPRPEYWGDPADMRDWSDRLAPNLQLELKDRETRLATLGEEKKKLRHKAQNARREMARMERRAQQLEEDIQKIRASRSWKITAPLRHVMKRLGRDTDG